MASTGSILSLDAIGKQDTFLSDKNNEDSVFNYKNEQHSNFAIIERSTQVDNPGVNPTWPFGVDVMVKLKPKEMGDLLANMYIKCELPVLPDKDSLRGTYTDQLGRAILESISFRVDTIEIEKIYGDWGVIRDELFLTEEEKDANKFMINAGQDYGLLPSARTRVRGDFEGSAVGPVSLYIPLNFFFSRRHATNDRNNTLMLDKYYKSYFPLCAIRNQEIQLEFKFNPIKYFAKTNQNINLSKFEIITEEIILSPQERYHFQSQRQEVIADVISRNPITEVQPNSKNVKMFLVPKIPVKAIFWFFRDKLYDQKNEYRIIRSQVYLQRFNFSAGSSADTNVTNQQYNPVMSDAKLHINGNQMFGFMQQGEDRTNIHTHNFFKFNRSMDYGLSTPNRNIYSYSFALKPNDSSPTGAIDFSTMDASRTFLDVSLMENLDPTRSFNMHLYYIGYQKLIFENGFMTLQYSSS